MPDISMCMCKNCPKVEECYRFIAIPDTYQSYSDFSKVCMKDNYKYFWAVDIEQMRKRWFEYKMGKKTKEVICSKLNKLYGEFLEEYITKYKDDGRIDEEECFIIRRVFEFIKAEWEEQDAG